MYKLIVTIDDKKQEHVFHEEKLAILYRDYHARFGKWASYFSWVREDKATAEEKKLILDEKSVYEDGQLYKMIFCGKNIKIELEQYSAKSINNKWKEIREIRNRYLSETDWTQLSDSDLSVELKKLYREYRKYLRILPTLHNDSSIATAKVCTFQEWKNGCR